jgi:Uma2 family endonuclease
MAIDPLPHRHRPSPASDAPRAPSREVWADLSAAERAAIVERLGPMPDSERFAPESDWHIEAVRTSEDSLEAFFRKRGRGAYIGRSITVYYPEERRFAPDLFVVNDVETHKRSVWNVLVEGRGLDFALEVHWGGDKRKDAERNVEWFARLGIPEYFLFDARRVVLHGWRLDAPEARVYTRIVPQNGRWPVQSLGLELGLWNGQPRWYDGVGMVPLTRELNDALSLSLNEAFERVREAEAERDDAAERAAAEAVARAAAEADRDAATARAAAAEAELERLRAALAAQRSGG